MSKDNGLKLLYWYTKQVHMSLVMSRPFKHSQSGIFYLRRRVPNDLIAVIGKREKKVSLKTKDPAEAKRRFS